MEKEVLTKRPREESEEDVPNDGTQQPLSAQQRLKTDKALRAHYEVARLPMIVKEAMTQIAVADQRQREALGYLVDRTEALGTGVNTENMNQEETNQQHQISTMNALEQVVNEHALKRLLYAEKVLKIAQALQVAVHACDCGDTNTS